MGAEANTDEARRRGLEAGKAAGSWVIDGNTTEETARRILQGYEDGDPKILDMQPSPLSGEWADGESADQLVSELVDLNEASISWGELAELQDEVCRAFEDGYADGYWAEVQRSARAIAEEVAR